MTSHSPTPVLFHNVPVPQAPLPADTYLPDLEASRFTAPGSGNRVVVSLQARWPNGPANIVGCGATTVEIRFPSTEINVGKRRYAHHQTGPQIRVCKKDGIGESEALLTAAQADGLMAFVEKEVLPCNNLGTSLTEALHVDARALLNQIREAVRDVTNKNPNQIHPDVEPIATTVPGEVAVAMPTRRFGLAER